MNGGHGAGFGDPAFVGEEGPEQAEVGGVAYLRARREARAEPEKLLAALDPGESDL